METVREYCEGYEVELCDSGWNTERAVIKAYNEGKYNSVEIDLLDLLEWLEDHGYVDVRR